MGHAFNDQSYNYLFSVPPGTHGEDVPYTFYNGVSSSVVNASVAYNLQAYLTNFIKYGDPNEQKLVHFPKYGTSNVVLNINETFINTIHDPASTSRCIWWQKALYA